MTEEQAKQRFLTLQAVRLVALLMVMLGAAILGGKILPNVPPFMGYALLIMGVVEFFLLPIVFKRAWQRRGP